MSIVEYPVKRMFDIYVYFYLLSLGKQIHRSFVHSHLLGAAVVLFPLFFFFFDSDCLVKGQRKVRYYHSLVSSLLIEYRRKGTMNMYDIIFSIESLTTKFILNKVIT
jgi:hypothetical protein